MEEKGSYKLAVMGSWEAVAAFGALGAEVHALHNPQADALKAWESMEKGRYALVIMTEPVYMELRRKSPSFPPVEDLPVVLVIPEIEGSKGVGTAEMNEVILRAVGSIIR